MRIRLMTFRYSATLGGFDDTPLVDWLRDKELTAFREYFYSAGDVPHLTCVLQYQEAVVPREAHAAACELPAARSDSDSAGDSHGPRSASKRRGSAPDPCEGLNETERALFNHVREWRADLARKQGVPPYVILTNRQVVAIIRQQPDSPTALGHVEGVGPGKLERYGTAILALLHGTPPPESDPQAPPQPPAVEPDTSGGEALPTEVLDPQSEAVPANAVEAATSSENKAQVQP